MHSRASAATAVDDANTDVKARFIAPRFGWAYTTWGDLATLEYGRGLRTYGDSAGKYRVFGTNGPIGWHHEALSNGATVVVGRKGAYRGVHYSKDSCFVIDTAFYLKARARIDMRWAYYQLLTQDINSMDSGSAIPSTSRDAFYHLPLALPPLPEQQAIAAVLGALDDRIELNRKTNQTLEALARAIFQSWFVDFDPVHANAAGRTPPGMDPASAALFPATFQDSALGPIPEGWQVSTLMGTAELSTEIVTPSVRPDHEFVLYSIPAFDNGRRPERVKGSTVLSNKFLVYSDAVLISKLNLHIPRVWLPDLGGDESAVCSTEFLVMMPTAPDGRPFLCCLLSSDPFLRQLTSQATGTSNSHQRVRPEALFRLPIALPPEDVISAFADHVASMLQRIAANNKESDTLATTRDFLLPKLLSGQVRVRDVERLQEATANSPLPRGEGPGLRESSGAGSE